MDRVPQEPEIGDAFGEYLLARLEGGRSALIYERDDGHIDNDSNDYFEAAAQFSRQCRWVLERAHGRVLDIGAGAGRASLHLQEGCQDVLALDLSPGALEVCRRRGVRQTFLGSVMGLADSAPEPFDSFVLLGNNLALMGTPAKAVPFLEALAQVAQPGARILGTAGNWTLSPAPPWHAAYHERNSQAGRHPGEIVLRTRFRNLATPWFELLLMSPEELERFAAPAGWKLVETSGGYFYAAHLERV
jgi:SAM-dependent methyltransferase